MKRAHILIGGYVHSVGFRRFVQKHAIELGLEGWVRNLSDRRVEVIVQGKEEKVESLVAICKKGPFMAEVKSVSVTYEEAKDPFAGFMILPTE